MAPRALPALALALALALAASLAPPPAAAKKPPPPPPAIPAGRPLSKPCVAAVLSQPANLKAHRVTSTSILYKWSLPKEAKQNACVESFNYQLTLASDAGAVPARPRAIIKCSPARAAYSYNATNLRPGAAYDFCVSANNGVGASPDATITVTTRPSLGDPCTTCGRK